MKSPRQPAPSRRTCLHVIASAATVTAPLVSVPASQAQAYDPGSDERRARYRETDDVRAFYRTNGYETKLKK